MSMAGTRQSSRSVNKEGRTMPNVEFVEITAGIRGKGNKDKKVSYKAISEDAPRPDNPMDAAMELSNADLEVFWKRFVSGYNEAMYTEVADPIAEYIDSTWDKDKVKNFRNSVNALSKTLGKEKEEVAEFLIATMNA